MKGFVCHKSIFSNFYERLWKFFVGFQLSRSISNYIALLSLFVQFHFVRKIIKFRFFPSYLGSSQIWWNSTANLIFSGSRKSPPGDFDINKSFNISILSNRYQAVCWLHTLWMSLGWFVLFICKFLISMQI